MEDEKVLTLGLNYTITPNSIPTHIIAATKATAKQLATTAEKLRAGVSNILQSSKAPKSNLPNHLRKPTRKLHNDQDIVIVILPADGNATVVMDCKEYMGKINEMLQDWAYGKIPHQWNPE